MLLIPHHHLGKLRFTELNEIYLAEAIKSTAFSLIGVFVPIYLLKLGYSFTELLLFFAAINGFRFVIEPLTGRLIGRKGPKHVLAWSYIASLISLALFYGISSWHIPLLLIALLYAIAESCHWLAYHTDFSRVKKGPETGREISLMSIIVLICSALGPLLGGLIAAQYGFKYLFILSLGVMLLAVFPLFQTKEKVQKTTLAYGGLLKGIKPDLLSHAGLSFDVIAGMVIWPLFIFLILDDYVRVGFVVTLSLLVSLLALLITGKLTDKRNKKRLIAFGSIGMSAVNLLRATAGNFWNIAAINIVGNILSPLISIPMFSIFYAHADRRQRIEYVVLLEMAADFARLTGWLILAALSLFLTTKGTLMAGFIMASVGILISNAIKAR